MRASQISQIIFKTLIEPTGKGIFTKLVTIMLHIHRVIKKYIYLMSKMTTN